MAKTPTRRSKSTTAPRVPRRDPGSAAGRLGDRTYERMMDDIVTCELPPGEEVTEAQLAERYGVGKAPIRSSLLRLRQDGLVRPLPRRGYLICPFTLEDVEEVYEARLVVEPHCAFLAAGRVDPRQLQQLEESVEIGYEPGDRDSERRFVAANRSIHLLVAEASGNRRLAMAVEQLLVECDRIIHLAMRLDQTAGQRFRHGHEKIIEALRTGDANGARVEAAASIAAGRELILDVLLKSPSLLGVELRLPNKR